MSKVDSRVRCVTKGVQEKVDNICQFILWRDFVTPMKITENELLEIKLFKTPMGRKQMVLVQDTLGRNIDGEQYYPVVESCNEEVVVFYDKDKNTEYMMLRSESEILKDLDAKGEVLEIGPDEEALKEIEERESGEDSEAGAEDEAE